MFGLDARKMSVKKIALNVLFLANLRRLTFRLVGGDSYSYKSQIAAMFGLDARIALAIFGALSVITGAALYSALDKVEQVSIFAELKENIKAIESYMIDTGQDLPIAAGYSYYIDASELISSSKKGWKGPYISEKIVMDDTIGKLKSNKGILILQNLTDKDNPSSIEAVTCVSAPNSICYYWVTLLALNLDIADKLDAKYDDGVRGTGDIRVWYTSGNTTGNVGFKGPAMFKQ